MQLSSPPLPRFAFPQRSFFRFAFGLLLACWSAALASAQTSFTVRHERAGGAFLWGIASGPTGLVVVGGAGTILTSPDGTNWTPATSGTDKWLVGVTYGGGKYIAVGDGGTILTSTDARAWTPVAGVPTTARLNNVVYGDGRYVAVGEAGTILTSTDGATWAVRPSGVTTWLRGLTHLSPGFVYPIAPFGTHTEVNRGFWAAGQGGVLLRSVDGVTWTRPTVVENAATADFEALVPLREGFFASETSATRRFFGVGERGTMVMESIRLMLGPRPMTGGPQYNLTYSINTSSRLVTTRLRGLAVGADGVFATGENGTVLQAVAPGDPWTALATNTRANLVAGVYHGNSLFVVGEGETILQSTPLYYSRLLNISTRARLTRELGSLAAGFVVRGTAPKRVLVRAIGPGLTQFGVTDAEAGTHLSLLNANRTLVARNAGWSTGDAATIAELTTTAARVGAFPLAPGSEDSALVATLPPGNYTAVVGDRAPGTGGGTVLVEVYDADGLADERSRAINISTLNDLRSADAPVIVGFTIGGTAARRVLIRVVGPSLRAFDLHGGLARPSVEVYPGASNSIVLRHEGPWSAQPGADEVRAAALSVGAFALDEGSNDVAFIATLNPSSRHSIVVRGAAGTPPAGQVLVEVYDLP